MNYAFEVPGYLQGFIFDQDPLHYDSVSKTFFDQAGYGSRNDLLITTGTPAFQTVGTVEGMTLDNTAQGSFIPAIPWEGAVVTVMKPIMAVNGSLYPVIFGIATTATNNGQIRLQRATAADYRHMLVTGSSGLSAYVSAANDNVLVAARAMSQVTRKGHMTNDGVTVTETSAAAVADHGNAAAPAWYSGAISSGGELRARFGNLSGTIGDTAATANTMVMFEMHFFAGNPLVDDLPELAAFIASLEAKHGI